MRALILDYCSPFMSYGGPTVDNHLPTAWWPFRSQVTGQSGNALGWDRTLDAERLSQLQARLRYAVRMDRKGKLLQDFQQVCVEKDLGVRGAYVEVGAEYTESNQKPKAILIRHKSYIQDARYTLAIRFEDGGPDEPTIEEIAAAYDKPKRTLFIGRKCCIPSTPMLRGIVEAENLYDALTKTTSLEKHPRAKMEAAWMLGEQGFPEGRILRSFGDRLWKNQVHGGLTTMCEGVIQCPLN